MLGWWFLLWGSIKQQLSCTFPQLWAQKPDSRLPTARNRSTTLGCCPAIARRRVRLWRLRGWKSCRAMSLTCWRPPMIPRPWARRWCKWWCLVKKKKGMDLDLNTKTCFIVLLYHFILSFVEVSPLDLFGLLFRQAIILVARTNKQLNVTPRSGRRGEVSRSLSPRFSTSVGARPWTTRWTHGSTWVWSLHWSLGVLFRKGGLSYVLYL